MSEMEYKKIIRSNLKNVLDSGYIPELGNHRSGKVRDVHYKTENIGDPIVMVASDRISCFDHILERRIPFKGRILNLLNEWALKNTADIIPNASMPSPHPSVIIQKRYRNIMIEGVVRGYVWGSLASEYEEGARRVCGVSLPDGLFRYQRLDDPVFTPTTKSEHDEPLTYEDMVKKLGAETAKKVKDTAIRLYKRGAELANRAGLIFIDTKYEFGLDEKGNLYLIDEANTPDSSRFCYIEEYQKFEKIKSQMQTGDYKNVSELIKEIPELKIQEMSKQFIRDVLTQKGFSYGGTGTLPPISDDDVVEVSYRYIKVYELLTGEKFKFPTTDTRNELLECLKKEGYIKGGLALIMAGSDSDMPHIIKIKEELDKFGIVSDIMICSAHKQPAKCEKLLKKYNDSVEPIVIIAIAGGTDALSGIASFHSVHPVISCPPDPKIYESCILNPMGSSNSLILKPSNAARHVAQILGASNIDLKKKILENNKEKILKLEAANQE